MSVNMKLKFEMKYICVDCKNNKYLDETSTL